LRYRRTSYEIVVSNSRAACAWLTRPGTGWHAARPAQARAGGDAARPDAAAGGSDGGGRGRASAHGARHTKEEK
jgi:hypothetical protein